MSACTGNIVDCWKVTERGSTFNYLFVGQILGPLKGHYAFNSNMIKQTH